MASTSTENPRYGRSLGGLFSDLWRDTWALVQEEVELARAETAEKVSQVGSSLAVIAIAGAILFAGCLVLLFAATAGLARALPPEHAAWLSPLIVGGVVVVIGFAALVGARRSLAANRLKPARTIASLRRDRDMVKEHWTRSTSDEPPGHNASP